MEEKTKKRSRKTKLIPRKDFDSDDENITEMQNNIEETIPQMNPPSKLRKLEPKQPQEEMEFSVKVEVEEVDENMTEELKHTEDLRDLDLNIKIHSVKSLCKPTQDAPSMSDDVCFYIDEDEIREDFESLSQKTTSLADKIIEIYLKNTFGKRTFLIESQSPLDQHLQKILRLWRSWYKSNPELREAPLMYICYVCMQGWWNFSEFREHLSDCREWKCLNIQTTNYQAMLIATDGFKIVVNGPALPTFDSNCWKCNKDRSIHLKCTDDLSLHLKSEYVCDGCNTEFHTCTALSFHEGECEMYRKKIFLINGMNIENNLAISYYCPICSYKDWDKDRLIIHLRNVHTVRSDLPVDWNLVKLCTRYNRPFDEIIIKSCASCTANFKCIPDLTTHLHNLVDDYKCKLCNKVLQKSCMEAEHMLEHTNNYMQLYKCPICPEPMYFLYEKSAKHHKSSVHRDHQKKMPLWLYGYKVIIPKRLFDRLQPVKNKPAHPPAIVDDYDDVDRTNDHHAHSDEYSQHLRDTQQQRDLETPRAPETGSFDAETDVEITTVNKSVPQELPDAVVAEIELDLEEEQRDLETPHAPETGSIDAETEVEITTVNKSVPEELWNAFVDCHYDAVVAEIELELEEEQRDLETPHALETGSFDAETEIEITTVNKSVPQELPDAVVAEIELDLEEEQRDLETPHAPETGGFDAETEVEITTVNKSVPQELPDAVVAEIELDLEEEQRDLETPRDLETGSFDAETEVEITTVKQSVPQELPDAVVAEIELDLEEEQRDLETPHAPETGGFDAKTEVEITTVNKSVPQELPDAVVAEIELDLEEKQRDLETPHDPETGIFDAESEVEITTVNKSVPQELPDAVVAEIELNLEEEQRDLETPHALETGSFDKETEVEITTVNKSVHQEPSDAVVAEIELDLEVSTEQCKIVTKPEINIKFPVKKTYVKKRISKSDNLKDKTEVDADDIEVEKEIKSDNIEVNENLMDADELDVNIEVENEVEVKSESVNEVQAIESSEVEIKQDSQNFRDYEPDIVSWGDVNSGGGTGDAEEDTCFEDVSKKLKRRRKPNLPYEPKSLMNKYKCTKCNRAWPTLTKYLLHFSVPNYGPRTCPQCLEHCHGSITKHLSSHVKSLFVLTYSIDNWMFPRARGNYHCKKCKEVLYAKDFFRHWESHLDIGENACFAHQSSVDVMEKPRLNEMIDTQEQPDLETPHAPETGSLIDADAVVAEIEPNLELSTEQCEIVTKPEMNIKFPVKKTYVKKKNK